ncbi:DUF3024 domain-containing protein [Occultella kanbiaonis]|uniref:DUF3024 domain-containing protein n=1 Tax=Occultella kanbiaonis TaxID=2675754 RepID=UPI002E2C0F16|nr:DUF3024 domain-containing protein [Occultella kanbiaonis]
MPKDLWNQVKVEADLAPGHVTIVEVRPPWNGTGDPTRRSIARLRWTNSRKEWSLYWRDRNGRFHLYDRIDAPPTCSTCSTTGTARTRPSGAEQTVRTSGSGAGIG